MPKRTASSEVTVRQLAPEQADEERTGTIYRPVEQLEQFPPKFKIEYTWFTPEMADDWVANAQRSADFKQRPIRLAQVRRWKSLMTSDRFVHFLPMASICEDDTGLALNGMHRMTALAGCPEGTKAGFVVVKKVPRWMFTFFDTNQPRTARDMFHIGGMPSEAQSSSMTKLAMRYEEFIQGYTKPGGWRHWNLIKDEHQDLVAFGQRRQELHDWYGTAERIYRKAKLLVPAVTAFGFYQNLAWPEGEPQLQEFMDLLEDGQVMTEQHPGAVLRRWALDCYYDHVQVFAKRETHLMLLFKQFAHAQTGFRQSTMIWAYGQPMTMPYHPKGPDQAIKNLRLALDELDAGTV